MTLKVCRGLDFEDLPSILRCEALKKWMYATEDQRETVWLLINDCLAKGGKYIPSESEVNDFIWLQCEEVFNPDDDEDDDDDEIELEDD